MKQSNRFLSSMLDFDMAEAAEDIIWKACAPSAVYEENGAIILEVPFKAHQKATLNPDDQRQSKICKIVVRAYGDEVIRVSAAFGARPCTDSDIMLQWHESMKQEALAVRTIEDGWELQDSHNKKRMKIRNLTRTENRNSEMGEELGDTGVISVSDFDAEILPDGINRVAFNPYDGFGPVFLDSIALGYVERHGEVNRCMYSLKASPDEKFAGTGERFRNMNLAGQTILMENEESMGVNTRRAYKNIPFYFSSSNYGLFIHTSAHGRLSLVDISTRAAQGMLEDSILDLFFIGGSSMERIVYNYRRITGFPADVPVWSYGVWMSKLTYYSAEETKQVAERMRSEDFPCDVIHIDTGWFEKPWKCDWKFDTERFPDADIYCREMKAKGLRISLWQLPYVSQETSLYQYALDKNYIKPNEEAGVYGQFDLENSIIDFSNPEALEWYREMLRDVLEKGVAVIKTDFGEIIPMKAEYQGMSAALLHNIYCMLYQKTAFEVTKEVTGEGIIWARAGWAGCQRYPVHWGGDSASTWDGLAGSIKGGLHIGVSGFSFWGHDIPGFYGCPDFNGQPADDLYVRWTQAGTFTSHMRYHGTSPREPYNFPDVADIVRKWFKLRYALVPYLAEQGRKSVTGGYPLLRAMVFHHENDPMCWNINDQFYCGENLLIAPVMNSEGVRSIYLPKGKWTDFWTGETLDGPVWLENVASDLEHIPVYAVAGSEIQIYPETVQCTDDMDMKKIACIVFDSSYKGISATILGKITGL